MFDLYVYPFPQFSPLANAFLQTLLLLLCPLSISLLLGGFAGLFAFVKCHPLFARARHPFPPAHPRPGFFRAYAFLTLIPLFYPLTSKVLGLADGLSVLMILSLGGTGHFAWHLWKALNGMDLSLPEAALAAGLGTRQIILRVILPESRARVCHALAETSLFLLASGAVAGFLAGGGLAGLAAASAQDSPVWLGSFALQAGLFLLLGTISARCAKGAER